VTKQPELCYIDVGGTFTDAFLVDHEGQFTTAKAPSTPRDVSKGFFRAVERAAEQMDLSVRDTLSGLRVLGYGATLALNTVLTRSGGRPGLIITRGFEQLLTMGRGKQSWTELDRPARIHPVTHRMLEPLIPTRRVRGVTERIDCLGQELIPLYEADVRQAVTELLQAGVDSIVICFLWAFLNESHEARAAELVRELVDGRDTDFPVIAAHEVSPVIRELPRANAAVFEAYVGGRVRRAFSSLEGELEANGFGGALQVMQSAGGLAQARNVKVVETIQSGPVGGLVGGRYIGELYDLRNIITTDVGGTSFDLGLITNGKVAINREPTVGRFVLGVPIAEVMSIGAGGGTIAGLDPLTGRLSVGHESAGADPGPVCYGRGGGEPTVTDANLVLGYLSPTGFAGGHLELDAGAAHAAIRDKIAEPLGLSVEEAASGIRQIIDARMRESISGLVVSRGFDMSEYHLLAFGGGGPGHVAGYTDGVPLAGILMFPYSSVFSAFGAASADYEHHYSQSLNMVVPPDAPADDVVGFGARITEVWAGLRERAREQMEREGFDPAGLEYRHLAMLRYGRQLNDLIVTSPIERIESIADWQRLIDAFEEQYSLTYARAARYPQAGYDIFEVGLVVRAPKIRPALPRFELGPGAPPPEAERPSRPVYFGGDWIEARIVSLDHLRPGNVVAGPGVVESSYTTVLVPPDRTIRMDEYRSIWMSVSVG
jgi:acetone carboxylase beta subunit